MLLDEPLDLTQLTPAKAVITGQRDRVEPELDLVLASLDVDMRRFIKPDSTVVLDHQRSAQLPADLIDRGPPLVEERIPANETMNHAVVTVQLRRAAGCLKPTGIILAFVAQERRTRP